jgi:hypothetical protein
MTPIRFLSALSLVVLFGGMSARAQQGHPIDVGAHYTYDFVNITANSSGLMGGGAQAQMLVLPHLYAVAQFDITANNNILPQHILTKSVLTLQEMTYAGGVRFLPMPHPFRLQPFAEVLVGGVHASGDLAPANTLPGASSNAFVFEAGGGLFVRLTHRLTLMPAEIDFHRASFNSGNNSEQELRLSAGLLFRVRR